MTFSQVHTYCHLCEPKGISQSSADIMKPQRASASKPGLELQILFPWLLGNSTAFKTLIKALLKLRTLLKYIGQKLYIYTAIVHSAVIYLPLTSEYVHLHLVYLYEMHSNHFLTSVHASTQTQEQATTNTVKMHRFIGTLLFLYHLGAPTQNLSEICGFNKEQGSEEGSKKIMPPSQSRI